MFALPGEILDAVFPALGEFLHQHFLFKGGLAREGDRRGQAGDLADLADAAAAGAVGGLDDDGIAQRQGLQIRVLLQEDAPAGGQARALEGQAHEVLVGGGHGAVHAVAHEAQALGHEVDRDGRQVRGDGADAHRPDRTADLQDALLLHDADRVEEVGRALADIPALPGEDVGGIAQLLCAQDQLVLKIIGADDDEVFFHGSTAPSKNGLTACRAGCPRGSAAGPEAAGRRAFRGRAARRRA